MDALPGAAALVRQDLAVERTGQVLARLAERVAALPDQGPYAGVGPMRAGGRRPSRRRTRCSTSWRATSPISAWRGTPRRRASLTGVRAGKSGRSAVGIAHTL